MNDPEDTMHFETHGRNRGLVAHRVALEVGSHLELLTRVRGVDAQRSRQAIELFDRTRALTWRLLYPQR